MRPNDFKSWAIGLTLFFGVGLTLSVFLILNDFHLFGWVAIGGIIFITADTIRTLQIIHQEQKQGKTEHIEDD